jgi:hypothetical protein
MHAQSVLQKPDAKFLSQATTINEQCHQHVPKWGMTSDDLIPFDILLANARGAYDLNIERATKNATTAMLKRTAFGELKSYMGMLINTLEGNSKVSDGDIELMGLRPRHPHAHQPLPRPNKTIVISVRRQHDEMTVYAMRPEENQPTATVGPSQYFGFALRIKVEGEPERIVISTRLHYTVFFDRADEGKHVTLSAAWVNPRLEEGPWSEEITEIIG